MRPILFACCVVLVALVSACSGTHESHQDPAVPATAAPVRNVPQLDVPGLLHLSIDEISHRLGPRQPLPADFNDPVLVLPGPGEVAMDSTALFRSKGLALVAAYNNRSRRVSDLLLLGTNELALMQRGQLQLGAANYLVLPVFQARHPTQLLGLRVLATTL